MMRGNRSKNRIHEENPKNQNPETRPSDPNTEALNTLNPNIGTQTEEFPFLKWVYRCAFLITFTLPNLIFSGRGWFDTLHIMKWAVTMIPVAVISVIFGFNLFIKGAEKSKFRIDAFAISWLILILMITFQPLFIKITSASTFAKEWFFFAALFAVYLLAVNIKTDGSFFRALLWGGSANASLNILFAELQIRNITTAKDMPALMVFLPDGLRKAAECLMGVVMDVPGNYIGNTGQQEMLGLWVAMAAFNCMCLHLHYSDTWRKFKSSACLMFLNMFFLAVNSCGLWRTTSRGAIIALFAGVIVMSLCLMISGKLKVFARLLSLIAVVLVFSGLVLAINPQGGTNRGGDLAWKLADMVKNPETVGGRIAIWRVSGEVFLKHPIAGVGLGHYKWHFLDGQGTMYAKHPEYADAPGYKWQYTYWAHSEYLQWLCETGIIGAALLAALGLWWMCGLVKALIRMRKKIGSEMPAEAAWGIGMLFMLFFDALFSRPFHRIENAVWMSLAFALANGFIFKGAAAGFRRGGDDFAYKIFGAFMASAAVCGLIFLYGGMRGDQLMLRAVYPVSDELKRDYISGAKRYLMSREDAAEQAANLDMSIGDKTDGDAIYVRGVNELFTAFKARPNSERLFKLFDSARRLDSVELMRELVPFLPPGSVSFKDAP